MISLKQLNPVLKDINPKELGVVCPNGQINFSTAEMAEQYAKNLILKSLKQNREAGVYTKDNRVLRAAFGDESQVAIQHPLYENNCNFYHGHTDETPFSPADVKAFIKYSKIFGDKQYVLYNPNGEECTLTMKSNRSSFLSKAKIPIVSKFFLFILNPINLLKKLYINKSYSKLFDSDAHAYISKEALIESCTQQDADFLINANDSRIIRDWMKIRVSALVQHNFLKKYLPKLGIDYKTNYECLEPSWKLIRKSNKPIPPA